VGGLGAAASRTTSAPCGRSAQTPFAKKVLKPAFAAAGLDPKTRLHDLRHFSCSNSVEAGQSVNRVAQRHGHADPGFTSRRYVHPFDESAADDMAAPDVPASRTAPWNESA